MAEPTYVMIDIYNDKETFLLNSNKRIEIETVMKMFPNLRQPENVYYEGALVITSRKFTS